MIPGISNNSGSIFDNASREIIGAARKITGIDPTNVFGQKKSTAQVSSIRITGDPFTINKPVTRNAWGNLSDHLLAHFYVCDKTGKANVAEGEIVAPLNEANLEASFNWQSPFEAMGPESKAPALMAMIQSGQLATVINQLQAAGAANIPVIGSTLNSAAQKSKETAKALEGRTGVTKLNSRQVFTGMPPVKITLTIYFRAIQDAYTEVVQPYEKLIRWAFPQYLAQDGAVSQLITQGNSENGRILTALFPSKSPVMVGMTYAKNRFAPMVIESMSHPVDGPIDRNGYPIFRNVQLNLGTLTALDRNDAINLVLR